MQKKTVKIKKPAKPADPSPVIEADDAKTGALSKTQAAGYEGQQAKPDRTPFTENKPPQNEPASSSENAEPVTDTDTSQATKGGEESDNATCVLEQLKVFCEHQKRPLNEQASIAIVPTKESGETMKLEPVVRNGSASCIEYEIIDPDGQVVQSFKGRKSAKIGAWYVKDEQDGDSGSQSMISQLRPFFRPEFFWNTSPKTWSINASGDSGEAQAEILVYPSDELKASVKTEELKELYKRFAYPFVTVLNFFTGEDYDTDLPEIKFESGPVEGEIKWPQLEFDGKAQWKEYPRSSAEWYKAYCSYEIDIKASPLFEVEITLDVIKAGVSSIPGIGPVIVRIVSFIDKHLSDKDSKPLLYVKLSGGVNGGMKYIHDKPDSGEAEGDIDVELKLEAGMEANANFIKGEFNGSTAITGKFDLTEGDNGGIDTKYKMQWEGIKCKVLVKLVVGDILEVNLDKEYRLVQSSTRAAVEGQFEVFADD